MDYQARFAQMANSMGLVADSAYEISEGFTALGLDIASLFNIDIASAMSKLQSGLAGQIRPMRSLGVDISKTSLSALALSYGITQSFEKMDAATKVQLRYLAVMQQLEIVYGDMARTIQSPANQARILAANFDLLKRAIGNSLIPMITWIMPYLNGIAIALTSIAQQIAAFFGFEMPDWKQTPIYSSDDIDYAEELSDSVDGVTESVKKYKNSVLGIDQLNLMSKQDTGGAGGAGGGSGGGGYAVLDKAIQDKTKKYMDEINKQVEQMTNKGKEFAEKIEDKMKIVLITVGEIATAIALWKISTGFATGINAITKLAEGGLFAGLGSVALIFAAIAIQVGVVIARFKDLWDNNENFRKGVERTKEVFVIAFGLIRDVASGVWTVMKTLGETIYRLVPQPVKDALDWIKTKFESLGITATDFVMLLMPITAVFEAFSVAMRLFGSISDETWNKVIEKFKFGAKILGEIAKGIGESIKNGIEGGITAITTTILRVVNGIINIFESAINKIVDAANFVLKQYNKIPGFNDVELLNYANFGRFVINDKTQNFSGGSGGHYAYATGGFPTPGEMFIAREPGNPELVGSIGGKTAVMNNNQIVSAVSQGVASAVKSVLGGGNGDITIKIVTPDGTVTGEHIIKAANRYNQRFGETIIQAG
jgi:hypothetical protein